jgi:hypothetical protein
MKYGRFPLDKLERPLVDQFLKAPFPEESQQQDQGNVFTAYFDRDGVEQ